MTALDYLVELISDGYEFPDALWKATVKFGGNSDDLTDEYDYYCCNNH